MPPSLLRIFRRTLPAGTHGLRAGTPALALSLGLALCLLAPAPSRGQAAPGPDGTVTANGSAGIERMPNLLRMQVELSADGKDAKEALAHLKAQEQSAREKLTKLGAAEAAVQFGDPQAAAGDRRQQMEMMVRQRLRPRPPRDRPLRPRRRHRLRDPQGGVARQGPGARRPARRAQELQAKVKSANLGGGAAAGKPKTPEEEEEAEEAAALQAQSGEGNPQEPVFVFVSRISEEDRAKATADAFKKAKADAERLAKAAGSELGGLRQLTSTAAADLGDAYRYGGMNGRYQNYVYGMMQSQQQGEEPDAAEAVGLQAGKVKYHVMVMASFSLK